MIVAIKVPGDFDTIQDAVDAAEPGDKIKVKGTFRENVVISTDDLTIEGEDDARLEPPTTGDTGFGFLIFSNGVKISNFKIVNFSFSGLQIFGGDSNQIKDNKFENTAVVLAFSNSNTIEDNEIEESDSDGLSLFFSDSNKIEDNETEENNDNGVSLVSSDSNTIEGNEIEDNGTNGVSLDSGSDFNEVKDNEIEDNDCDSSIPPGLCS